MGETTEGPHIHGRLTDMAGMTAASSCMALTGWGTEDGENRRGVATKIKNLAFYWKFNSS